MEQKKKIFSIIVCLILVISTLGCAIYIFNKSDKENNDNTLIHSTINKKPIIDNSNNNEETLIPEKISLVAEYDEITKMVNNNYSYNDMYEEYFIVKNSDKYGVIDYNGNIIEEIKYSKIAYLIDEYYYTEEGNIKTLKRKGNIVSDISNYEKGKVYKDESDGNSLYIMLNEYIYNDYLTVSEDANIINLGGTLRSVYFKNNYKISNIEGKTGSIIYDASTGKIITEINGTINKPNNIEDSNYIVTHELATYMRKYTYLNKEFKLITDDNTYFYSAQCDGNTYASAVTDGSKKYGYFSTNKEKLIIPIKYQNIYSVNDNETLFVVKNNDKYGLLDNKNKIVFPFEYDYIVIINNYIVTIKDNNINFYDKKLKKIDKYSFKIDIDKKIASYGLCNPEYEYINISRYVDEKLAKISFYTEGKLKTILFYNDNIELYEEETNIIFGYSQDNKRYIIMSSIIDNLIKKVEVYNHHKDKLFEIDTTKYNISLSNNELPLDYVSSIYNISYDFDCRYFVISYNGKDKKTNKIYYDLNTKEIIDNAPYLYCINIDENYFYYPIYDKNNSREKYELHNHEEKIMDFINDIEIIKEDYFLIDRIKIYKINK